MCQEHSGHSLRIIENIWMFPKIGVPQNGWFVRETPIEMDDLGVPLFLETPIYHHNLYLSYHYTARLDGKDRPSIQHYVNLFYRASGPEFDTSSTTGKSPRCPRTTVHKIFPLVILRCCPTKTWCCCRRAGATD